jgi:hypothetical protein
MARAYVTLDGYVVRRTSEKAVGIAKDMPGLSAAAAPLTWLPRSACTDGDALDVGDTDIVCAEWIAEERGLDFE